MVSLCNVCRDDDNITDITEARNDAEALAKIGVLNLGVDQTALNNILYQRNWKQLQLIFKEYEKMTGYDIGKVIKNEFAVTRSIKNQASFFARLFRKCVKGFFGTKDRTLIRLVVSRCEVDMKEIKKIYEIQYGETLADAIKGDTSGDYQKCLLRLIGESDNQ
ncbi:annexin B11-like [Sitophilus oryzae]|uniref:Annexin B11-like n=1 Tax=Sitophilus oryzae TaxID=7048 RepID=A0A6J2XK37_SITOR|nr:annexin B11-like [Sitophilus oryzae]